MFKGFFGKKKKEGGSKNSKNEADENKSVPIPPKAKANQSKNDKKSRKKGKKAKSQVSKPSASESPKKAVSNNNNNVLRHRKKKGKKPKFKKIAQPKEERNVGTVQRKKDKFFPGDVDFSYSSPKESWVSCFGRKEEESLDFGDSVRILSDDTHH